MATEIPTHSHEIIDTDLHFTIDPVSKKIIPGSRNLTIAQHAVNSERFTFYIPDRLIEGHDMSTCNQVKIHYRNIDQETQAVVPGIYTVTDLNVADDDSVTLSWLIGGDAALYTGALIFSIHFACVADDGTLLYNFPTLTFSEITVGETTWNSETIARQYPDIIAEFEARIKALESGNTGSVGGLSAYEIAQANGFEGSEADWLTSLIGPQGEQGPAGADGATVEEVLAAMPVWGGVDFSNFANGSFTEIVDGETVSHSVTNDESGIPIAIDGKEIKWG